MVIKTATFDFVDSPKSMCDPDDFVLRVPLGIQTKDELFASLASAGHFPGYFGVNWDALLDCLRDLSWISNPRVLVIHGDLPLHNNPAECRIYLEILRDALAGWAIGVRPDAIEPPPEWPYVDHELRVVFPSQAKGIVDCIFNISEVPAATISADAEMELLKADIQIGIDDQLAGRLVEFDLDRIERQGRALYAKRFDQPK